MLLACGVWGAGGGRGRGRGSVVRTKSRVRSASPEGKRAGAARVGDDHACPALVTGHMRVVVVVVVVEYIIGYDSS